VEQEMVANERTEGMEGRALLPAILIEPEIQEVLIGKDRKRKFAHLPLPFYPEKVDIQFSLSLSRGRCVTGGGNAYDGICPRKSIYHEIT
jgi:hypothetical protein